MNQEKLTSEQAFNLLVQLAHQVKLTLSEGESVKQALQVIADLIREDSVKMNTKSENTKELTKVAIEAE